MTRTKTKLLSALLAAALCMTAMPVAAFASGDDWCEYGDYGTVETSETAVEVAETTDTVVASTTEAEPVADSTEAPAAVTVNAESAEETLSTGNALTPSGNLTLVDDAVQTTGGDSTDTNAEDEPQEKQFLTVQSKNGNYFYIVVDRSGDTENVHFLNQVDEADLLALIEAPEEEPAVCICTDKCVTGDINTACPVCQTTMSKCVGTKSEPVEEPETEPEEERSGAGGAILLLLVLAVAGGGALYYFKLRKPKADTGGPVDLDGYNFGEDEDEGDEDYEFEPDEDEEPEEHNEGD